MALRVVAPAIAPGLHSDSPSPHSPCSCRSPRPAVAARRLFRRVAAIARPLAVGIVTVDLAVASLSTLSPQRSPRRTELRRAAAHLLALGGSDAIRVFAVDLPVAVVVLSVPALLRAAGADAGALGVGAIDQAVAIVVLAAPAILVGSDGDAGPTVSPSQSSSMALPGISGEGGPRRRTVPRRRTRRTADRLAVVRSLVASLRRPAPAILSRARGAHAAFVHERCRRCPDRHRTSRARSCVARGVPLPPSPAVFRCCRWPPCHRLRYLRRHRRRRRCPQRCPLCRRPRCRHRCSWPSKPPRTINPTAQPASTAPPWCAKDRTRPAVRQAGVVAGDSSLALAGE